MAFVSEDQSIFCGVLFVFRMYYQNDGLEGLDLNGGRRHCPFCPFAFRALSLFLRCPRECRFCTAAMLATRAASRAHSALHRARPADRGRPMRPSVRGRRLIGRRHRRVWPAAAWRRNAGVPALPMMSGWCRRSDKADGLESEQRGNMPSSPPKKDCSHTDLIAFQHTSCTLVARRWRPL